MTTQTIKQGDCINVLRSMPDASIDAVVTDPPYDLTSKQAGQGKQTGFMGKSWDGTGVAFRPETWREVFRVLKPGSFLLSFGGTRTYHRMTCAIEDAGFEIRDCIGYHYGSGFPKSLSVSSAIDKAARGTPHGSTKGDPMKRGKGALPSRQVFAMGGSTGRSTTGLTDDYDAYVPATDAARQWSGWGTALKPAWEPIVVARRPLEGTVAANVLRWGTGALNIDACRIGVTFDEPNLRESTGHQRTTGSIWGNAHGAPKDFNKNGRWPANVLLSCPPDCDGDTHAPGCPCAAMDAQSGGEGASRFFNRLPIEADDLVPFFYTAKASRKERNAGLPEGSTCTHPTVKPVSVMRHLLRLCCREGGTVLDPFMGSGTTGIAAVKEGMHFIGMELSEEYVEIARSRIAHHGGDPSVSS